MFVLCPRCELNYIEEEEEYCKICKAEMGLIDPSEVFMPEDEEVGENNLCPLCKINYVEEGEEMCVVCKREKEEKEAAEKAEEESINNWQDDEVADEDDEMTISLSEIFNSKHVGRGTIIKPSEPQETPPYNRLLPVSKFITEDNRFSPPGVEWLYLAVGESQDIIQKGAEKECRAKPRERFAFCNFKINTDYSNLKVVDLTIADNMTYNDINNILKELEEREYDRAFKYVEKYGYWAYRLNYKNDYMKQDIAKWVLRTYAKMMSKNIFVP